MRQRILGVLRVGIKEVLSLIVASTILVQRPRAPIHVGSRSTNRVGGGGLFTFPYQDTLPLVTVSSTCLISPCDISLVYRVVRMLERCNTCSTCKVKTFTGINFRERKQNHESFYTPIKNYNLWMIALNHRVLWLWITSFVFEPICGYPIRKLFCLYYLTTENTT